MYYKHDSELSRTSSKSDLCYHTLENGVYEEKYDFTQCQPSLIYTKEFKALMCQLGKNHINFVFVPYERAIKRYLKFLSSVSQFYRELDAENIVRLEKFCKELLTENKPSTKSSQCNIHKSIFFKKIIRNKIIKVILLFNNSG